MKKNIDVYAWIKKFINEKIAVRGTLNNEMKQILKSCEEIVDLLITEISKVYDFMFFLLFLVVIILCVWISEMNFSITNH